MAPKKKQKPLGWTKMNDALRHATEEQALKMLNEEKKGDARIDFMSRIYARYNKMRRLRELEELKSAAKNVE